MQMPSTEHEGDGGRSVHHPTLSILTERRTGDVLGAQTTPEWGACVLGQLYQFVQMRGGCLLDASRLHYAV